MNSVNRNTASAALKRVLRAALVTWALGAPPAWAAPASPPAWSQHVAPASEGTRVLALTANAERSAFGMLYSEAAKESGNDQVSLLGFDAAGKPTRSLNLTAQLQAGGKLVMHNKAGLALDSAGVAYLALAGRSGTVQFARVDLRRTAAPLTKSLQVGGGSVEVRSMLLSKSGALLIGGSVDGKGFLSSVTPNGELSWTKMVDARVAVVLDLVETEQGLLVLGGMPGQQYFRGLWLGRVSPAGEVLEHVERDGPMRFARLSGSNRQLALIYEKLGRDMDDSTVLVEQLSSLRETRGQPQTVYQGHLTAPFTLSRTDGQFVTAGVTRGGKLQLATLDAAQRVVPLYSHEVKAPDYVRFHSVELVAAPQASYLGGLRSRADGNRQQLELIFARIATP